MIIEKYEKCINDLGSNLKIKLVDPFCDTDLNIPSEIALQAKKKRVLEFANIEITKKDFLYFQFSNTSVCWNSNLPEGGKLLTGGFQISGITDSLYSEDNFWKGAIPLAPDKEVPDYLKHYEKLSWFEKSADETTAPCGCFIRESGIFPPPIAIYYRGWYKKLDIDFQEYLSNMFDCYAFQGWQFFHVDFPKNIKDFEEIIENMQFATEMLPKVFPNKDWSFYVKQYQKTLSRFKL